jgi:DNA-directed RNA polymerase subunit RPC12/RpoP
MSSNKITINLKDAETLKCSECQNETFVEVYMFKKVSKLMTGSPEDSLVPFPSYKCDKCGNINQEFDFPQ